MRKGIKRRTALFLSFCMVLSLVTAIPAQASRHGEDEKQFGLWLSNAWRDEGSYYIDTNVKYDADNTDVAYMQDYSEWNIRHLRDQVFYFDWIDYDWSPAGDEESEQNESLMTRDPEAVTDASKLTITYMGNAPLDFGENVNDENKDNWNYDDARWAKAASIKDSDASIEAVDGEETLFQIRVNEPGYYIISYGDLEIGENGFFKNSDAAINFVVREYNGLGVKNGSYSSETDMWSEDAEGQYGDQIDGNGLLKIGISLAEINNFKETPIKSAEELKVYYYGSADIERYNFESKQVETGWVDPRYTYRTSADGDDTYRTPKETTNAELEADDSVKGLFYFTPDLPGLYLITNKELTYPITDENTDENREILDSAVLVKIWDRGAGFFSESSYSGVNALYQKDWTDSYAFSLTGSEEKTIYLYVPDREAGETEESNDGIVAGALTGYEVSYDGSDYNYSYDNKKEIFVLDGEEELDEGKVTAFKQAFSLEALDKSGWYSITISNISNRIDAHFETTYGGANLGVSYIEGDKYYLQELNESNYFDDIGGCVNPRHFIFKLYKTDEKGTLAQITGEELSKYQVYTMENPYNEGGRYDGKADGEDWSLNNGEILFAEDGEKPNWILVPADGDTAVLTPSEEYSDYLDLVAYKEGNYAIYFATDEMISQVPRIGAWLPAVGIYNTKERYEDGEKIDNLVDTITVYEGMDTPLYGLAWVELEGSDGYDNAIDVDTMDVYALQNNTWVEWEDGSWRNEKLKNSDAIVRLDKGNPVIQSEKTIGNPVIQSEKTIGYPVVLTTDEIPGDFTLYITAKRNNGGVEEWYVDVSYKALEKIEITESPTKTEYVEGERFEDAGLVVTAVYEDGKTALLDSEDYTITIGGEPADGVELTTENNKYVVQYHSQKIEGDLSVSEKEVVNLSQADWDYQEAFTADGEVKTVSITGLPKEVVVKYEGDYEASTAGTYTAKATLSIKEESKGGYKLPDVIPDKLKSLSWEIKSAPIIQSGVDCWNVSSGCYSIDGNTVTIDSLVTEGELCLYGAEHGKTPMTLIVKGSNQVNMLIFDTQVTVICEKDASLNYTENDFEGVKKTGGYTLGKDTVLEGKAFKYKAADEGNKAEEDKKAADAVSTQITTLPNADVVKAENEAIIVAARKAYDALTPEQKALVSDDTLKKLKDAEEALKAAIEKAEAEKKAAEEAAAKEAADKKAAEEAAAKEAAEKKAAEEAAAKEAAEKKAAEEAAAKEAAEKKAAADKAAADAVTTTINALPASTAVAVADEAKIADARKAYDALIAEQKALVTADTLKKLTDAEAALDAAKKAAQPADVGAEVTDSSASGDAAAATYTVTEKATADDKTGEVEYTGVSNDSTATSITIPDTITGADGVVYEVTKIADGALKDNTTVKAVTVGDNIEEIGEGAFENATKLTKVKLGRNVTSIDKNAFAGCTSLKKVTASGKNVTTIADAAFKGDKSLTTVDLSKSTVTSIGKDAFSGDKKLKTIKLNGNKLKKIGKNAFKNVKKNATITINAKDKTTYNKVVKLIKKSGAKNVKYKFKKKK